jgi:hypothetical protein
VLASLAGSAVILHVVKRSGLRPAARELVTAVLSITPAALALGGGELAGYHGAEHVSIGSYEHGESRPKEHERCGSHLVGPMLLTTALGNLVAERAPARLRNAARAVAGLGAVVASVETFGWMTRNPLHPVSRLLAKPGHELQHRFGTASRPGRSWVAEAALRACQGSSRDHDPDRLEPIFDLPVEKMQAGCTRTRTSAARGPRYEDGRRPRVVMQVFQKKHAYLGGMDEASDATWLRADGLTG